MPARGRHQRQGLGGRLPRRGPCAPAGLRVGPLHLAPSRAGERAHRRGRRAPSPTRRWRSALAARARGSGAPGAPGRISEPPTYFETLTAAALRALPAARVDIAVLEVGMGGRLDATNVADPAGLGDRERCDFDHEAYLGRRLAAIAREKAGVMRAGARRCSARCPGRAARASRRRRGARARGCGRHRRRAAARTGRGSSTSRPRSPAIPACARCRARTSATTSLVAVRAARGGARGRPRLDLARGQARPFRACAGPGACSGFPADPPAAARRRPQPRRGARAGRLPARRSAPSSCSSA